MTNQGIETIEITIEASEDIEAIQAALDELRAQQHTEHRDEALEQLRAAVERLGAARPERTWPVTIPLRYPIEFAGQRIESLTFRRGRIGDIKGMKFSGEMPAEQLVRIASRLSGQEAQVIERLDMEDSGEVMAIATDFFARCLGAGKKH
ncbi:MAG TPA: phage tail assembly protein [Kofleriaceae bacterium]|nr:phage tail assembly protein [Kofleriaceae bacterium]